MAIKRIGSVVPGPEDGSINLPISSITVVKGDLLVPSGNVLILATAALGVTTSSLWQAVESATTADTEVKVRIVTLWDLFEVDTTADTATSQILERMILTDEHTINNSSTDVAADEGIFECLAMKGAVGDRKLIGRFIALGQDADVS